MPQRLEVRPPTVSLPYCAAAFYGIALLLGMDHPTAGDESSAAATSPSSASFDAQQPQVEPGWRCRLFWIGHPLHFVGKLAPAQSPNVDLTIQQLTINGDEPWFVAESTRYSSQYVLLVTSRLKAPQDGDYAFRVCSAAATHLTIDGAAIAETSRTHPTATAVVKLCEGSRLIEIEQWVDQLQGLDLTWRPPGCDVFAPIPADCLEADAFYFRPTNGGRKRLLADEDRPGRRMKVAGLYPGLDIATLRPQAEEVPVGGLDFLPDGRLVVATFDARRLRSPSPQSEPDGELWVYENVAADDVSQVRRRRIASELYEPAGVCVVGESIYVSQRNDVTRFDYSPSDDRWQPTVVASGWETNDFHGISFGLVHLPGNDGHPGKLFMAKGTGLGLAMNPPNHGSVWRIDLSEPVGENVHPITGGHRTPNGIGIGPGNNVFVTDNQGEYTPANELNHIQEGRFYGFEQRTDRGGHTSPFQKPQDRANPDGGVTPPAVYLPQDEIGNSPSEPVLIPDGWPFAGQMLVGDVKYGGVNRISLEEVSGVWQGAAYRFTQGLEAGVNRLVFGPNGDLIAGGIGGDHSSTWHWIDPQGSRTYQGLERLRPNGRTPLDIEVVEITPAGFRIRFTKTVDSTWLGDPSNFELTQWRYEPTAEYGGPKINEQRLEIDSATPGGAGRTVELTLAERPASNHVVHFSLSEPTSTDGEPLWSTEAWYTVHKIPNP